MKITILIIISAIFALIRFFMPTHNLSAAGSYEAFAHLFVGGLIGAYLVSREKSYLILAVTLSGIELLAFFTLK